MKNLKRLAAATLLSLVLSLHVFAGDIFTGVVNPPPPPPDQQTATANDPIVNSDESVASSAPVDPTTEAVLSVIENVLAIF